METLTPQEAEDRGYKSITLPVWLDSDIADVERDMKGCAAVWVFFPKGSVDRKGNVSTRDTYQCYRKQSELKSSK